MARLKFEIGTLWTMGMAAVLMRPASLKILPPEAIALMLRMALPISPKLSEMLVGPHAWRAMASPDGVMMVVPRTRRGARAIFGPK